MTEQDAVEVKEDIWRADDMVNHPPHYTQGDVECIDAIKASMELREYIGFLKGQVIKYIWRFEKKWDPTEDLKKARYYLEKLIEFTAVHDVSTTVSMNMTEKTVDAINGVDLFVG